MSEREKELDAMTNFMYGKALSLGEAGKTGVKPSICRFHVHLNDKKSHGFVQFHVISQ